MTAGSTNTFRTQPWYRKVVLIVLLPFVLPTIPVVLLVLACIGLYAAVANFVFELRVRRRMRRCGRWLSSSNVRDRIAASGGTLIIEAPSLGWNFTHAWWTSDDVLSTSPYTIPTEEEYRNAAATMQCLDWDRWCWDNYTSLDNGRAFLLRVCNGASVERRLRQRFADLRVVRTWTALVHVRKPPEDLAPSAA